MRDAYSGRRDSASPEPGSRSGSLSEREAEGARVTSYRGEQSSSGASSPSAREAETASSDAYASVSGSFRQLAYAFFRGAPFQARSLPRPMSVSMPQIFLCIGAPRAGTTWLYENLRRHRDVFLPPVKELRHFLESRTEEQRQSDYNRRRKSHGKTQDDQKWLDSWIAADPRSDETYLDLLTRTDRPVAGDISPVYSIASPRVVRRIRDTLPDGAKIVYIIRNPIDRDWSHMKFTLHRQMKISSTLPTRDYLAFLTDGRMKKRSNYVQNIARWTNAFPLSSILVTFYDKLQADPVSFFEEICSFVGAGFAPPESCAVNGADTPETAGVVPDPILKRYLAERHLPMLEVLSERYPEPCAKWLVDAKELIARQGRMGLISLVHRAITPRRSI
jgi:Sulfotransferase family